MKGMTNPEVGSEEIMEPLGYLCILYPCSSLWIFFDCFFPCLRLTGEETASISALSSFPLFLPLSFLLSSWV